MVAWCAAAAGGVGVAAHGLLHSLEAVVAAAARAVVVWAAGDCIGGGGSGLEGLGCSRLLQPLHLLLEVCVPVVLDVVVGSLREVRGYGCPPASKHRRNI